MAKKYTVLRKKLKQLESDVNDVLDSPPDESRHQIVAQGIYRKLGFFKSLLSAEIESHPSNSHHLHHMEQRVTELEIVFRQWDEFNSLANHIDTASDCSCTESCFNDDGDGLSDKSSRVYEDPEPVFEEMENENPVIVVKEEKPPVFPGVEKDEGDVKEVNGWCPTLSSSPVLSSSDEDKVCTKKDDDGLRKASFSVRRRMVVMFTYLVLVVVIVGIIGCWHCDGEVGFIIPPT